MKRDFTVLLAAIDFRPSVSLLVRQGGGCRLFPFGRWRLLTWGTENSKHSKCSHTCGFSFFSGPLPENSKLLVWIVPNPYEERRRRIRNGGLDVTQNRRSTRKIHYGRTKLPALQRFFSFPVLRGRIACLIWFRFVPVRLPLSAGQSSRR